MHASSETLAGRIHRLFGLVLLAAALGMTSAVAPATADDLTRFELDDGSVVLGEALGLADGVYRIRTPALGDIDVEAARIQRMSRAAESTGAGSGGDWSGGDASAHVADIEAIQRRLVGDGSIMQSIIALQQDPDLQAAIADPELMGLITSGNVDALRSHPGFERLMAHPGIRGIIEQLVGPDGELR